MLPKTESERLSRLNDNLLCLEADLRDIAGQESDTTIVAACDLAADYVQRAARAAQGRIESIEIGLIAMEESSDVVSSF